MNKYKVCPVCKAKNIPAVLECIECGNDLMGVRVVDDSIINNSESNETASHPTVQHNELVRICDCGQVNEVTSRKCISCGEDISDIIPSHKEFEDTTKNNYGIKSIDGEATLLLHCPSNHIIGRECELSDYLNSKSYVSRVHAKITVTSEGVFIENLSRANGTYVNNEKIDNDKAYKLCIGDEIGLGGISNQNGRQKMAAYFILEK